MIIIQMYRKPNSKEILTYFSEFLTQIGIIMANIKKQMYELIQVPMIPPKINSVFNSMASIMFSTHRTYADLKKIQSVMAGYMKSRVFSKKQWSLNSTTVTQRRSRSEQSHFMEYPKVKLNSTPTSTETNRFSNFSIKNRPKNQLNAQCWFEPQKNIATPNQYSFNNLDNVIQESETKKQIEENQSSECKQNIDCDGLSEIKNRISKIMMKNRKMAELMSHRNRECLQIISQVKQQLCINV